MCMLYKMVYAYGVCVGQVELLSARLAQAEQDVNAAQEASATSYSQAIKYEGDMSALRDHCRVLEDQIR